MSKQDFLDRLRAALNGRIAPSLVTDNINYYEDYINMEIRKGRREAEVLQMLGDPRLIAKTIIDTNGKSGQAGYQEGEYQSYQSQNGGQTSYENHMPEVKRFRLPGWLWGLIVILIIVGILSMVFSVLSFLAPIIIPILVVMFFVKLFRDWLN